jgi:hypothetical protein
MFAEGLSATEVGALSGSTPQACLIDQRPLQDPIMPAIEGGE